MRSARTGLVVTILIVIMSILACQRAAPPQPEEINIGCVVSITGPFADIGLKVRNSADLAVCEINEADGIAGKKVKLLAEDDAGDPERSRLAVKRLVEVSGVRIVVGPLKNDAVMSSGPYASEKGVLFVSPSATSHSISAEPWSQWVFRTSTADTLQGKALADVVIANNYSKVAILYVKTDYGAAVSETAKKELEDKVNIVTYLGYDSGKFDYQGELVTIKDKRPDCVLHIGYLIDSIALYQQGMSMGLDEVQWLVSKDAYDEEMLRIPVVADFMQRAVKGIRPTELWKIPEPPPGPICPVPAGTGHSVLGVEIKSAQDFASAYSRKFGSIPGTYCDTTYDSVKLLALAIQKAGIYDANKIRDALWDVGQDYVGASGTITFDKSGQRRSGPYEVWEVRRLDDKYKFVPIHLFTP